MAQGMRAGRVPALLRPRRSLSPGTAAVYGYMREFFTDNDQLPPIELVRKHMGWASQNAVVWHIKRLESIGMIERNAVDKYRFSRGACQ